MTDPGTVVVLAGGDSPEREVSLESASCIARALEEIKINYKIIDAQGDFISVLRREAKLVFIAMHGGVGENGSIQGLLEVLNIPYTGSGVLSSAMCMDKAASKRLFSFSKISTPVWQILKDPSELKIRLPAVMKPSQGGSTIGTVVVNKKSQINSSFERVKKASLSFRCEVMAEEYIPGREITVGILNGKSLPIIEIKAEKGFYDYRAKYEKGMSEHLLIKDISTDLKRKIRDEAEKVFRLAGCRDMARVDFRLWGDKYYMLEINTIPGMTPTSLLPEAASAAGIEFKELVRRIIENACSRSQKRQS